jgi:hypothetical protein
MNKMINDKLSFSDKLDSAPSRGLWVKTEVIGGYDLHTNDKGISELGEVIFHTHNMVPIGGVQFVMEMLYGVTGPIVVPTLNDEGIGVQDPTVEPSGGMPYPYGQKVCLFGVGTGGANENNLTALEVKYNEYKVSNMVPFRYTALPLSESDKLKYFGIRQDEDATAYFLKTFDAAPSIKHLYKDGEDGEDGSEVTSDVYQSTSEVGIESFTETLLTISKKDVREWFAYHGGIEVPRVNSIGLFTAVYDEGRKDYANIKLFSKLNIPTETLSLAKDMNIIYRVYGA